MASSRLALAAAIGCLGVAAGTGTCSLAGGSPAQEFAVGMLGIELFLGFGAVALALLLPGPLGAQLGLGRGRLPPGLLALLALGTLGLSHALDSLIEIAGVADRSVLAEIEARLAGVRGSTMLVLALGVGIAPGIAEELLCRGLIQRRLAQLHGAAVAIPLAALVFGAIHLDPVQGPAAFVLGLYLGAAAYLAGSTWASILCHSINNLTALGVAASSRNPGLPGFSSAALGLGIAGIALWLVWRWGGAPRESPLQPERRPDDG